MPVDLSVYAIVDPAVAGGHTLAHLTARIVSDVTLVQLRDKDGGTRATIEEARAIKAILAPRHVPLLINDRVDVALAARADGVHIGQDDMKAEDARSLLGQTAIIGLSIKTMDEAVAAPLDHLDYVAVGGVFVTTSKVNTSPPTGIAGLRDLVRVIRSRNAAIPICAIAGITVANAADVIDAGADGVAVISALSLTPDPGLAARELRGVVDQALKRRGRL